MIDDVFDAHARCLAAGADDAVQRALGRALRAPLQTTPGEFGLDRLLLQLDQDQRVLRGRCRKRRLLRWTLRLRLGRFVPQARRITVMA